jgi:hypothetical protein
VQVEVELPVRVLIGEAVRDAAASADLPTPPMPSIATIGVLRQQARQRGPSSTRGR